MAKAIVGLTLVAMEILWILGCEGRCRKFPCVRSCRHLAVPFERWFPWNTKPRRRLRPVDVEILLPENQKTPLVPVPSLKLAGRVGLGCYTLGILLWMAEWFFLLGMALKAALDCVQCDIEWFIADVEAGPVLTADMDCIC
ncbi:hypothetical protein Nepgr_024006 [Nepenthes gracilis]|uniref:Transmembrane protein n=1 Tax=Nepenthes gracilis TaxID=150966 RepID=A0AAD3T395_NEPGR|nr:hypothetical protein Nepgr_024006 [Nepenthes gracilis]